MLLCPKTSSGKKQMKRLHQLGGLFLPIFHHFIHSNMQCPSPFTFVYLQHRPENSYGMEHPQSNSWTVPGREKSLFNQPVLQSLCFFLEFWHSFCPRGSDSLSADPTPSLPTLWECRDCLSAALTNPEHVTHPLHYLYWLLTSWFLFI